MERNGETGADEGQGLMIDVKQIFLLLKKMTKYMDFSEGYQSAKHKVILLMGNQYQK